MKTCLAQFEERFSMEIVDTVEDGNCFFDSLLQSGAIMEPIIIEDDKDATDDLQAEQLLILRNQLVDYLQQDEIIASLDAFGFNNIEQNIQQLRENSVYQCDAGDLPTQFAHEAFGVHLNIFIIEYHTSTKRTVVTLEQHRNLNPVAPTVNVIRMGEHFKLLRPQLPMNELNLVVQHGIDEERPFYENRQQRNRNAATVVKKKAATRKAKASKATASKAKTRKANNAAQSAMTSMTLLDPKLKAALTRAITKLETDKPLTPLEQQAWNHYASNKK